MTPRGFLGRAGAVLAAALVTQALARPAHAGDPTTEGNGCLAAILAAEGIKRLPPGLLGAIALVESGRPDPRTGRPAPWPWTINVAGAGFYFQTKGEAVDAVLAARARGVASIDVGCMQVNLLHHPNAFTSLEEAFDPQANAAYGALFLTRLFQQSGSWPEAAASYHSATPGLREDYQRRVLAGWAGAARYGGVLAALPLAPAKPVVDALRQYTPAFRAQLAQNASDRASWVALGIVPAARAPAIPAAGRGGGALAAAPRSRIRLASLARAGVPADD